jgi:hypothetical protein
MTVADNIPPIMTCTDSISVLADHCNVTLPDIPVTITDNCDMSVIAYTQSPPPGTILGIGNHDITFTAVDASGNNQTCTSNYQVNHNPYTELPTIYCPSNITGNHNNNYILKIAYWDEYSCYIDGGFYRFWELGNATDECGNSLYIDQYPNGEGFFIVDTITQINLTATDENGNTAICTFYVYAYDNCNGHILTFFSFF